MPRDESDPIDFVISSITSLSEELRRYSRGLGDYSNDVADKLERNFNEAAGSIRSTLHSTRWLPDSIKPPPPPPPAPATTRLGFLGSVGTWMNDNRALTAAVIAFVGTGTYLVLRRQRLDGRKRRAKRGTNGAKTELVVLAGSPYSTNTKSIALDLERRGFLVYIPVGSLEEEQAIAELRVPDVHSLNFDITSPESTSEMLEKLSNFLINPQRHGTQRLHFASLIIAESDPSNLPTGPTGSLSTSLWSDALNTHILYPISLLQAFLPLLISESKSSKPLSLFSKPETTAPPSTIVVITPSNIPAIHAPNHAAESTTTAALTSYFTTLRHELPASLSLTHIRLGALSAVSSPADRLHLAIARINRYQSSSTPASSASSSPSRGPTSEGRAKIAQASYARSSALRELHYGIFDAVVGNRRGTVFIGRGARAYAFIGAWAPNGLVGWMMGFKPLEVVPMSAPVRRTSDDTTSGSARSVEWEKVDES